MTRQADLYEKAIRALRAYIATGHEGFALLAYDRFLAGGMTETALGKLEDWDQEFANALYLSLREAGPDRPDGDASLGTKDP